MPGGKLIKMFYLPPAGCPIASIPTAGTKHSTNMAACCNVVGDRIGLQVSDDCPFVPFNISVPLLFLWPGHMPHLPHPSYITVIWQVLWMHKPWLSWISRSLSHASSAWYMTEFLLELKGPSKKCLAIQHNYLFIEKVRHSCACIQFLLHS